MTYWTLINKDPARDLVYVACRDTDPDLGRVFREVTRDVYSPRPWRIIYKNAFDIDYEVKLDHSRWPRSYGQWDRRFNPDVVTERWHGVVWDALKGSQ